ncbi:MAG: rhodanese-related sulfurtransferase [Candidatus Atelocyanobacterium thalassa]
MSYTVATFYKFIFFSEYAEKKSSLFKYCQDHSIKGTILLSQEGINGTIAGTSENVHKIVDYLKEDVRFIDLEVKYSMSSYLPFKRIKVRLKQEIVTLGISEIYPEQQVGTYVDPEEWNNILENEEIPVIDTRNIYEIAIGTFKGAINPQTHFFREFPSYIKNNLNPEKHKKVAMFCTGGIRCEKASSYLLKKGFKEVFHLKGGILNYLKNISESQSLWEGECFVFDERVAVKHKLEKGNYKMCTGCGYPIADAYSLSNYSTKSISCPHCSFNLSTKEIL